MSHCYPLSFEPILKEKVWGGRRLSRYGKVLPESTTVGESWEVADLASTSVSGGGGGAAHSRITNGPLAGSTIRDAATAWGDSLAPRVSTGLPLLVKFLDAREHLSVQVHPSPAYAATHPEAHLKTECWYVLEADPDAVIFKGIRPGVTPEDFARHIEEGTVVNDLVAVPAVPGEMHNLPSGTCHALGAGVLVAEIQTPSDTTFRVYDWAAEYGRTGRELHVSQSLECIDFGPAPDAASLPQGETAARLVTTEFFTVDELRLSCEERSIGGADGCVVIMVLDGRGTVSSDSDSFEDVLVEPGRTVLVPHAIVGQTVLRMGPESVVLRAEVV